MNKALNLLFLTMDNLILMCFRQRQNSVQFSNHNGINISFNTGYDYSAYIQYDHYGAVIQIENTPIYYDYYGRISQAGNVHVNYDYRGRVSWIGNMP